MKSTTNKGKACGLVLALGCLASINLHGQEIAKVESLVNQWLGIERQNNALESQWQEQQPILQQRLALLAIEKQQLSTMLSEKSGNSSEVEQQRLALIEEQSELEKQQTNLTQEVSLLINQLSGIQALLPPPLKQSWLQESAALDSEAELSVQLQVAIAQLTKLAEFNQAISVLESPVTNEQNQQVLVKQLYLGASNAWFVSLDGSVSGSGKVTDEGWQWQFNQAADSEEVSKAIAIFERQSEADFVSLPFTISAAKGQ